MSGRRSHLCLSASYFSADFKNSVFAPIPPATNAKLPQLADAKRHLGVIIEGPLYHLLVTSSYLQITRPSISLPNTRKWVPAQRDSLSLAAKQVSEGRFGNLLHRPDFESKARHSN
eukprot:Gb_09508 [translate_table: standard]